MGEVYRAWDLELGREVAVKLLAGVNEAARARFARELRAQIALNHPSVCPVFEAGEDEGRPYIVMRLVKGLPLLEALPEMTLEQAVEVFAEVAEALHAAHARGFVHRDIKPSNLMVERVEGRWHPWVMDFGLVAAVAQEELTRTGETLGTPAYMAPEQIRGGDGLPNRRADVYGVGATMYRAFTGRVPFEGRHPVEIMARALRGDLRGPREVAPSLPAELEAVILKAMEVNPERRYASARDLAADLRRFLAGEAVTARPPTVFRRLARAVRKRPALASALLVAVLAGTIAAGLVAQARWRGRRQAELAVRFGREASDVELALRMAALAPRHDMRPDLEAARRRLERIVRAVERQGPVAKGPAEVALGQGELALGRPRAALEHLGRAWKLGMRGADVALLLGRAYGEVFRTEVERARASGGTRGLERARPRLEREYRDPALRYLRRAEAGGAEGGDELRALIAFHEGRLDTALKLAERAAGGSPQRFELERLRGEILLARSQELMDAGEPEAAWEAVEASMAAFGAARRVARSGPRVHEGLCEAAAVRLQQSVSRGRATDALHDEAAGLCRDALVVNPESRRTLVALAGLERRWGDWLRDHGESPEKALARADAAARRAVAVAPSDAAVHAELGRVLLSSATGGFVSRDRLPSVWDEALAELTSALKLEPAVAAHWTNRGLARWEHARWLRARGGPWLEELRRADWDLGRAGALDDGDFRVWTNLGAVRMTEAFGLMGSGGDPLPALTGAVEALHRARRLNPRHPVVLNSLGAAQVSVAQVRLQRGLDPAAQLAEAIRLFGQSMQENPSNHRIYNNLATAYLLDAAAKVESGRPADESFARGFSLIEKALALNPRDVSALANEAEGLRWLAESQWLSGRDPGEALDRAKAVLQRMRGLAGDDPAWLTLEGRLRLLRAKAAAERGVDPRAFLNAAEKGASQAMEAGVSVPDACRLRAEVLLERARWEREHGGDWEPIAREALEVLQAVPEPARGRAGLLQARIELLLAEGTSDTAARHDLVQAARTRLERVAAEMPLLAHVCRRELDRAARLSFGR